MASTLDYLKVLITRPKGQGDTLLQLIQQEGGHAWHYPVMDIVGLSPDKQIESKQHILDLDQFQHVIFISTNAVCYGIGWIDQYWPQLPVAINWYAIGESTAQALKDKGLSNVQSAPGAMNSEALLNLDALQKLDNEKVLIVRGVGGRDYLREVLQSRGAKVSYAECYRRQCAEAPEGEVQQLIKEHHINTICCNSIETISYLSLLVGKENLTLLHTKSLIVPSERVALYAEGEGFLNIIIADNASDESIVSALKFDTN